MYVELEDDILKSSDVLFLNWSELYFLEINKQSLTIFRRYLND